MACKGSWSATWRMFLFATAVNLAPAVSAKADIVLNTMGANQGGFNNYAVADGTGFNEVQSVAIPFTVTSAVPITTIVAKIGLNFTVNTSGELHLGIMGSVPDPNIPPNSTGWIPSGTFLPGAEREFEFSQADFGGAPFVDDLVIKASDLAVPVTPGATYWLAAVADDGFDGSWVFNPDLFGVVGFTAFGDPTTWTAFDGNNLPQALVGTPEPITLAMFGVGLFGLGLARRRPR